MSEDIMIESANKSQHSLDGRASGLYPDEAGSIPAAGSTLHETGRQEYTNCILSAGHTDHEIDTIYLRFEREGEEPTTIYLRPDEALSCIWLLSGALWSREITEIDPNTYAGKLYDTINWVWSNRSGWKHE